MSSILSSSGDTNPYKALGWKYIFRKSSGADDTTNNRGYWGYDPNGTWCKDRNGNKHPHKGIDVIVGNTGASDTAHLHLDISTMPLSSCPWSGNRQTYENTINPVNFFPNVKFPVNYYNIKSYI